MNNRLLRQIVVSLIVLLATYSQTTKANQNDELNLTNGASIDMNTGDQNKLLQVDESKDISQLLRSNVQHFWTWAKQIAPRQKQFENDFTSPTGIIMGDAHLGNMHPSIDSKTHIMTWKNIDLDDSGIGSFVLDFTHLVLSVKVISKELKIHDMVDAYIKGLNNQAYKLPKSIHKYMNISSEEYEKMRKTYVLNKTKQAKFILKKNAILNFDSSIAGIEKFALEKIIKKNLGEKYSILDLALISKDRGGSAGKKRIWALLQAENELHIFELKELDPSGLGFFQSQLPIEQNFVQNRNYFGYDEQDLPIVQFHNTYFILREKKITLFDVPYNPKTEDDANFLEDLAIWGSYNLGKWHTGQTNSLIYTQAINAKSTEFLVLIKELQKEYRKLVTETFNQNKQEYIRT